MQELPRKSSLRAPCSCAAQIRLFWMCKFSEEKFDRLIVVRLDSADLGRRHDNDRRLFLAEEFLDCRSILQVQLGAGARQQTGEALLRQLAQDGAADQATMAGDERSSRLFPSSFPQHPFSVSFFKRLRNAPAVARKEDRLRVQKTYKLFIGGKFVRSESGRVAPAERAAGSLPIIRAPRARIFATRSSPRAARSPAGRNRAPICADRFYIAPPRCWKCAGRNWKRNSRARPAGKTGKAEEASLTIERLVHYAGWTDKFSQIFSAVNPVASSHFNFTMPEPTGVVVVVCPNEPPLLALVSLVAPVILSGNTAVVLASATKPLPALTFSEIIATSDLPGGVVNILSGNPAELAPHIASHMDVNAIVDASGDGKVGAALQQGGGFNVKRYVQRTMKPADWRTANGGKSVLDSRHRRDENRLASDRKGKKKLNSTARINNLYAQHIGGNANFTYTT